jgi:hypothetical protein
VNLRGEQKNLAHPNNNEYCVKNNLNTVSGTCRTTMKGSTFSSLEFLKERGTWVPKPIQRSYGWKLL